MEITNAIPASLRADVERLMAMTPWASRRYTLSDAGNGYLLADFYRDVMRYAADRGCWYVYDGRVWKADPAGFAAMSLCKRLVHAMSLTLPMIEDEAAQTAFARHLTRWRSRRARETALREAAEVYPVRMGDFDRDPMLFNCLNGTLHLVTREFRPPDPADFITHLADVTYNPTIRSDDWDVFVTRIMETDSAFHPEELPRDPVNPDEPDAVLHTKALEATANKAIYLQKAFGYALTGETRHDCFFILHGPSTRNGKSTLVETFAAMLGDYAAAALPETLAQQRYASAHGPSEDIARLTGTRFVSMAELDQTLQLSPSLLKRLTGNDTITCRFLRESSFQYQPQFKLFLNTNHLPACLDDTLFRSGRVRVIEFERHIPPEERDLTLKERLRSDTNRCAVLNWALKGLEMLLEDGFDPPECVLSRTEAYRDESDPVKMFVSERLIPTPGALVRTAEVYRAYCRWCEDNGFDAVNSVLFKRSLARMGMLVKKRPSPQTNPTICLRDFSLQPSA